MCSPSRSSRGTLRDPVPRPWRRVLDDQTRCGCEAGRWRRTVEQASDHRLRDAREFHLGIDLRPRSRCRRPPIETTVISTHMPPPRSAFDEWRNDIARLGPVLHEFPPGGPVVVGGDLNATPTSVSSDNCCKTGTATGGAVRRRTHPHTPNRHDHPATAGGGSHHDARCDRDVITDDRGRRVSTIWRWPPSWCCTGGERMWLADIDSRSSRNRGGLRKVSAATSISAAAGGGCAALRTTRTAATVQWMRGFGGVVGHGRSRWTCGNSRIRQFRQISHHSSDMRSSPSEHQPAAWSNQP